MVSNCFDHLFLEIIPWLYLDPGKRAYVMGAIITKVKFPNFYMNKVLLLFFDYNINYICRFKNDFFPFSDEK